MLFFAALLASWVLLAIYNPEIPRPAVDRYHQGWITITEFRSFQSPVPAYDLNVTDAFQSPAPAHDLNVTDVTESLADLVAWNHTHYEPPVSPFFTIDADLNLSTTPSYHTHYRSPVSSFFTSGADVNLSSRPFWQLCALLCVITVLIVASCTYIIATRDMWELAALRASNKGLAITLSHARDEELARRRAEEESRRTWEEQSAAELATETAKLKEYYSHQQEEAVKECQYQCDQKFYGELAIWNDQRLSLSRDVFNVELSNDRLVTENEKLEEENEILIGQQGAAKQQREAAEAEKDEQHEKLQQGMASKVGQLQTQATNGEEAVADLRKQLGQQQTFSDASELEKVKLKAQVGSLAQEIQTAKAEAKQKMDDKVTEMEDLREELEESIEIALDSQADELKVAKGKTEDASEKVIALEDKMEKVTQLLTDHEKTNNGQADEIQRLRQLTEALKDRIADHICSGAEIIIQTSAIASVVAATPTSKSPSESTTPPAALAVDTGKKSESPVAQELVPLALDDAPKPSASPLPTVSLVPSPASSPASSPLSSLPASPLLSPSPAPSPSQSPAPSPTASLSLPSSPLPSLPPSPLPSLPPSPSPSNLPPPTAARPHDPVTALFNAPESPPILVVDNEDLIKSKAASPPPPATSSPPQLHMSPPPPPSMPAIDYDDPEGLYGSSRPATPTQKASDQEELSGAFLAINPPAAESSTELARKQGNSGTAAKMGAAELQAMVDSRAAANAASASAWFSSLEPEKEQKEALEEGREMEDLEFDGAPESDSEESNVEDAPLAGPEDSPELEFEDVPIYDAPQADADGADENSGEEMDGLEADVEESGDDSMDVTEAENGDSMDFETSNEETVVEETTGMNIDAHEELTAMAADQGMEVDLLYDLLGEPTPADTLPGMDESGDSGLAGDMAMAELEGSNSQPSSPDSTRPGPDYSAPSSPHYSSPGSPQQGAASNPSPFQVPSPSHSPSPVHVPSAPEVPPPLIPGLNYPASPSHTVITGSRFDPSPFRSAPPSATPPHRASPSVSPPYVPPTSTAPPSAAPPYVPPHLAPGYGPGRSVYPPNSPWSANAISPTWTPVNARPRASPPLPTPHTSAPPTPLTSTSPPFVLPGLGSRQQGTQPPGIPRISQATQHSNIPPGLHLARLLEGPASQQPTPPSPHGRPSLSQQMGSPTYQGLSLTAAVSVSNPNRPKTPSSTDSSPLSSPPAFPQMAPHGVPHGLREIHPMRARVVPTAPPRTILSGRARTSRPAASNGQQSSNIFADIMPANSENMEPYERGVGGASGPSNDL